jgi:hypothetical protein
LDSKQLEFVRNDLSLLDREQLVVLLLHGAEDLFKQGRRELFEVLEKHPYTVSVAGHVRKGSHRAPSYKSQIESRAVSSLACACTDMV